jgi:hypothetical protein
MISKKIIIALAVLFLGFSLSANDEMDAADKCEAKYSVCLETCDSSDISDKDSCYDKCDENYSKCLDEIESN